MPAPPALGPRWSHQMGPPEPGTNLFATALWDSGTQALLTISQAVEGLVPQVAAPKGRHQTCVQETWSHPEGAGRGGVHGPPVTCANLGLALGSSCEHAKTPPAGRWMEVDAFHLLPGHRCWVGAQVCACALSHCLCFCCGLMDANPIGCRGCVFGGPSIGWEF